MNDEPVIRFEIEGDSLDDLRAFADENQPDLGCRPIARKTDAGFVTDAYLPESRLAAARLARTASRIRIRVIENATEIGRQRMEEVGTGNRFSIRGEVPHGLGRKE